MNLISFGIQRYREIYRVKRKERERITKKLIEDEFVSVDHDLVTDVPSGVGEGMVALMFENDPGAAPLHGILGISTFSRPAFDVGNDDA